MDGSSRDWRFDFLMWYMQLVVSSHETRLKNFPWNKNFPDPHCTLSISFANSVRTKRASRERWSEGGRREGSPSLLFLNSPILPQFYPPSTKILVLVLVLEGVEDALIIPLIRGIMSVTIWVVLSISYLLAVFFF